MGTSSALSLMTGEADLPRSIRHGPPITITCECGERRHVRYGDSWHCEKCGREWSTLRIPLAEYAQLRRTHLRYRRIPLGIAAVVIALLIVLVVSGRSFAAIFLAVLVAMG